MIARRLTDSGISEFVFFLDSLSGDAPLAYPEHLLEHEEHTALLGVEVDIDQREFGNRFDLAAYLDAKFSDPRLQGIENDAGLWAWLALFYFKQACRDDGEGKYRPGEIARWIPQSDNFRKYYRHLIRGPFSIYRAHRDRPERAMALLCGPVREPGDVVEQLSARQELVTNPAVMDVASALYYDPEKKQLKRGAAGRGPGSARRLADLLNQLDVTWDLYGMDADRLLKLLPREFDKFQPHAAT